MKDSIAYQSIPVKRLGMIRMKSEPKTLILSHYMLLANGPVSATFFKTESAAHSSRTLLRGGYKIPVFSKN